MKLHVIRTQSKMLARTPEKWAELLSGIPNERHRRLVRNIVWWDYISQHRVPLDRPPDLVGGSCTSGELIAYLLMMGYSHRNAVRRAGPRKSPDSYPKYARKKGVAIERMIA